jgi:hypothetical protein
MKKIYIAPSLVTVKIAPISSVLMTSDPDVDLDPDSYVDAGSVETKSYINDRSIWEEEW